TESEALAFLDAAAKKPKGGKRKEAGQRVAALLDRLRNLEGDEDELVEELVEIGAPAIPRLIEGLGDEDLGVGLAAGAALAQMGAPGIRALLDHVSGSAPDAGLDALAELGPALGDHLLAFIREAPGERLAEVPVEIASTLGPRPDVLE